MAGFSVGLHCWGAGCPADWFGCVQDHNRGQSGSGFSRRFVPIVDGTAFTATTPPQTLFRVTAYCACEKCCGEWAKNRPNGVVYGAAGIELVAGVSAASPLPLGTVVEVEGLGEYVVQDRPAKWVIEKYGENQLDIYFDNHEEACAFGLQYLNVYIKEEPK